MSLRILLRTWRLAALVLLSVGLNGCGNDSSGRSAAASSSDPTSRSNGQKFHLLNVSYDPTRELWKDLNKAFEAVSTERAGSFVTVKQSHGASGSQARAVIDGLEADVVSLALWGDTEQLHRKGLLKDGWEDRLPNRSLPYTSTIVFVVRKGNPKGIHDWPDLVRPNQQIITPNPKTSGNGKLAFLAAWGSVVLNGGTEDDARDFVTRLYQQVPVLDTGARGATTTFAQKGIGDVHLTWENEAHLEITEAKGDLQIVYPSQSILAEPHVALVDDNVDRRGTRAVAQKYLEFLYTPTGQEIIAKHFYRPFDATVLAKHRASFPDMRLFRIDEISKGWDDIQRRFFADGGEFDRIYTGIR
jgi:sulfate/thiosulfate-binding protein